jgi:hypothetical protein
MLVYINTEHSHCAERVMNVNSSSCTDMDPACPKHKPLVKQNMTDLFSMFAQTPVDNYVDIRRQIHVMSGTPLSQAFYSEPNVAIIQNGIRAQVYALSKGRYVIDPPNTSVVRETMKNVFVQYARPHGPDAGQQIQTLNNAIIGHCASRAFERAKQYIRFVETQGKVVTPMTYPTASESSSSELRQGVPW